MMEILGAISATSQLIETGFSILDLISQLRDFLKYAPARYQGWHTELAVLGETISSIRQNALLQTRQVRHIIEGMAPKIKALTELCAHYAPEPKLRLYARLTRALSAKGVETRIHQNFRSLEHDKTTLILTITTMNKSVSIEYAHQRRREEMAEKVEGGPSRCGGMYNSPTKHPPLGMYLAARQVLEYLVRRRASLIITR